MKMSSTGIIVGGLRAMKNNCVCLASVVGSYTNVG
jgi:hypothetical protein